MDDVVLIAYALPVTILTNVVLAPTCAVWTSSDEDQLRLSKVLYRSLILAVWSVS